MNEIVQKYWSLINWEHPERGYVYGIRSESGRWAARVYEFTDENLNPLPGVVAWRGSDDEIVDFFHDYLEEHEQTYDQMLAQYYADLHEINSL